MFYSFIRGLVRFLVYLINGKPNFEGKENLPSGNYILVGPHRTWFDPLYFALAASPKNPILRFILKHANAFPVDRKNPGPSVIKTPVKLLKKSDLSLIMFPSGTRHSQEMKGGVVLIAKMTGVPIIPAVYQGPLTLKALFSRKKTTVRFGGPIYVDRKTKLTDETQAAIINDMEQAFTKLDKAIDPSFHYIDPATKK